MEFRLGTRKSALARTQSEGVRDSLVAAGLSVRLVELVSEGDRDRTTPLYAVEVETPGLFTKHLEKALLASEIDLAVHSLKDLPTSQPAGLVVAAVTVRVASADSLLVRHTAVAPGEALGLKRGARVGTSSLRREAQLLSVRPDLEVVPVRGNVPTRVRQAREGGLDAVILAAAGLDRLKQPTEGLRRTELDESVFVPAPGQGALAVETRVPPPQALEMALAGIHDIDAETETRVERRILKGLHGGCTLPLGVRCHIAPGAGLSVRAFLGISRPGEAGRRWVGFRHFDFESPEEEILVARAVGEISEWMRATEGNTRGR